VLAELESLKKKEAKIPVSATGVERTNAQIDHAARDRDSTIRVTYEKTNDAPGEHSGTRTVRQTSIVPQLFDSPETVAGVRGAARSGGTVVATAVAAAPRSVLRGGTLTQLAPKQVPIKVYLDGAEIADHLTLKADRMASASSVRRRA
jgi:hypothetical protein